MTSGLGGSEVRPPSSSSSPLLLLDEEGELLRSRGPSSEGDRDARVIGDRGAGRVSTLLKNGLVG